MQVIQAEPADAESLAELVGALLTEIMTVIGEAAFDYDVEQSSERLHSLLKQERCYVLYARNSEGGIAGFAALYESVALYAGGEFGTISEFYVRPEYRSSGIGAEICDAVKAFAEDRGWQRLEVTTPPLPAFERTLAFYERQGFTVSGGRKLKCSFPA